MLKDLQIIYNQKHSEKNPLPTVFLRNQAEDYLVWLDSSKRDPEIGRLSILGTKPLFIIKTEQSKIFFEDKDCLLSKHQTQEIIGSPNEFLRNFLKQIKLEEIPLRTPFKIGLMGYFGYEYFEAESKKEDFIKTPDSFLIFPSEIYIYDHYEKILHQIKLKNPKIKTEKTQEVLAKKQSVTKNTSKLKLNYEISKEKYYNIFKDIQDKIYSGEMYECCFTHKIGLENLKNLDELYLDLRKKNKAPFSAFLKFKNFKILSCSPERFLKLEQKTAEMRPIKGTIKRGRSKSEELENLKKLKNSIKDRAENIMIVDLIRNDLGKVSEFGSVKVKELFKIEKYSSLFQMISIIESKIEKKYDFFDLLEATFPGGSMTGAPKIRAMEYLKKYEKTRRGIYSGSIGYIDLSLNSDLNIVIRTIIADTDKNKSFLGIGGAIVFDSKKTAEYKESILKAKRIIEIIKINRKIKLTRHTKKW